MIAAGMPRNPESNGAAQTLQENLARQVDRMYLARQARLTPFSEEHFHVH